MNLEAFEELAKTRRTCRHFLDVPLEDGVLERLLACAQWAPSGYNLQPLQFITVTEEHIKRQLFPACMNQRQILEAPAIVIFAGEENPMKSNFEATIRCDTEAGAMTREYEQVLRRYVPLAFSGAPFGLGALAKKWGAPVIRLFRPVPEIPLANSRFWSTKQVMLSAMNFMLAAHAAGLATVPMEGFDEGRVKKIIGIPGGFAVPILIPVGYATPGLLKKSRLPLARIWHRESWKNDSGGV